MKKRSNRARTSTVKQLTEGNLASVVGGDDIGTPQTVTAPGQTGCTWAEAIGARVVCVVQWT